MSPRSTTFRWGLFILLPIGILFASTFAELFIRRHAEIVQDVTYVLYDPATQWFVYSCLAINASSLLIFLVRYNINSTKLVGPVLWLSVVLFFCSILYVMDWSSSVQALTLLGGVVLGLACNSVAISIAERCKADTRGLVRRLVILLLTILLTLVSIGNVRLERSYLYRGYVRWSGLWDNPNIFGLLMGTGIVLSIGNTMVYANTTVLIANAFSRRRWSVGIFVIMAPLLTRGLLHSYSRGAWLGAACGLIYTAAQFFTHRFSDFNRRLRRNMGVLVAILISFCLLGLWRFRATNWLPAQRGFSLANSADFSWRNRIAAWDGALQIMTEHIWLGAGWNKPETLFGQYYVPPKLAESMSIQLNDYLMLGATLGIPALFCFCMYFWQSLFGRAEFNHRWTQMDTDGRAKLVQDTQTGGERAAAELEWLKTTCRAGAIVLAVGFWFDGGLFKLATASVFWILLELGSVAWGEGGRRAVSEKVCQ